MTERDSMKLIRELSGRVDEVREDRHGTLWLHLAIALGGLLSSAAIWVWGVRPEVWIALGGSGGLKTGVFFALSVSAFFHLLSLSQVVSPASLRSLSSFFAILSGLFGLTLLAQNPGLRLVDFVQSSAWVCLVSIPLLSLPILVALGAWQKHSRPLRVKPVQRASACLAGLLAAAAYSLHCPHDEASYVVIWYGLGLLIALGAGQALLKRVA